MPNSVGKDTVMFPGFDGGAEWGGSAFDPATHILYLNANDVGLTESLVEHKATSAGESIYQTQCALCHGANLKGQPPAFPSLENLQEKGLSRAGDGPYPERQGTDAGAAGNFRCRSSRAGGIRIERRFGRQGESAASAKVTYDTTGYHKFFDQDGYPAVKPPWGTLNAINLDTGDYVWKIPFGEYPELVAQGLGTTGSENYGGPVVTAGGVVFIAATVIDKKIRAYDKRDGKLLWEYVLPFPANVTPAVYEINGRGISCGGVGRRARAKNCPLAECTWHLRCRSET